jgi:hypothetical protein
MEVPQGKTLRSYLKQPKMSFFFFFSYTKLENKRMEQILPEALVPVGGGRRWGNGEGG